MLSVMSFQIYTVSTNNIDSKTITLVSKPLGPLETLIPENFILLDRLLVLEPYSTIILLLKISYRLHVYEAQID